MVDHTIDGYISSAKFVFLRLTPVSLLESDISLAVLLTIESEPTLSSQFFKPPAGAEELHTNMNGNDMVIRQPGEIYDLVQALILLAVTQPKFLRIAHIIASSIMYCNRKKTSKQEEAMLLN